MFSALLWHIEDWKEKKRLKEEKSNDFSVNWLVVSYFFSCFGCNFIMLLLLLSVIVNAVQILEVLIYWFLKGKMQVVEGSVLSSPSINRLGKSIGTEANIFIHVWYIGVLMEICKGFRYYIRHFTLLLIMFKDHSRINQIKKLFCLLKSLSGTVKVKI